MQRDYLRVETLVRCKKDLWTNPNLVLRVIKRKGGYYKSYFVGVPGAPYGHGAWVREEHLIPLTPLELLAMQCDA